MRIYTLQIHEVSPNSREFDEVYNFADFSNLCREFENKFNYFRNAKEETVYEEYPYVDDNGDASGRFEFNDADGSVVIGKVYDYDILDED